MPEDVSLAGGGVLVVEDDLNDAVLLVRALRSATSRHVVVVQDGEQALDYLLCRGRYAKNLEVTPPVLVLLDLGLATVHGLDILKAMRGEPRLGHVPAVVLTSETDDSVVTTSYALGANSVLRKPLVGEKFTAMVQQTVAYWLGLNMVPLRS